MREDRKNIASEFTAHQSDLNSLLSKHTLPVPEGYFEQLAESLATIPQQQTGRVRNMYLVRFAVAAAAVFLVVYAGIRLFSPEPGTLYTRIAEMDDAELDAFMQEQLEALTYDELIAALDEEIIQVETEDFFATNFSDTAAMTETLHAVIHEQVFVHTVEESQVNKVLEEHYFDAIEDAELQEYLNNEAFFDDLVF